MESFHTGILNKNHWWHDWVECVRGIHLVCPVYAKELSG
jgi:hypothetical protein